MQKSYIAHHQSASDAASEVPRLCVRVEMPHSHADGWAPEEIGAFADEILGSSDEQRATAGLPLVTEFATIAPAGGDDAKDQPAQYQLRCVVQTVGADSALSEVELVFSRALGYWPDRRYNRQPVPKNEWKRLPSIGKIDWYAPSRCLLVGCDN